MALTEEHHLLRLHKLSGIEPVEIHAARHLEET